MKKRSFMIVIVLLIAFITLSCSKKSTEPEVKTVATPTFTPPGGTFTSAQTVTMHSTTLGVTIVFTTDGTEPNSSSQVYSNPILVNSTTTIKGKSIQRWLE